MGYKMKGSTLYGKGNTSPDPSPNKHYSVDKGSHNHPHGDTPNKFLGKIAKGIGGALKGAVTGKDGKFGIGDVGRLAMGPLGAAAGATGLFAKEKEMKKTKKVKTKNEERNQFGETRAEYIKRMEEMGLRKPDAPSKMKSPAKLVSKNRKLKKTDKKIEKKQTKQIKERLSKLSTEELMKMREAKKK